jgi:hypothetical protein
MEEDVIQRQDNGILMSSLQVGAGSGKRIQDIIFSNIIDYSIISYSSSFYLMHCVSD